MTRNPFAKVSNVRVRLDVKIIRDEGEGTVSSSPSSGVTVNFNKTLIDIRSISVTAAYNASYGVVAVYEFTDTPNPTSFKVYLFRADTGVAVTGSFRWTASGV